jgi:hypothetical protein
VIDLISGNVNVVPCEFIEANFKSLTLVLDPSFFTFKVREWPVCVEIEYVSVRRCYVRMSSV